MQEIVENKKQDLRKMCQMLKVKKMYVFGSVVSDDFKATSDIDFLIAFADDLTMEEYADNYFALQYGLRSLFNRDVDIVTERTLSNPYFIERVNATKQLIYEG